MYKATPVEDDVAGRLPYKYVDSYDDRETANNLILHENGFEGYNWNYLNNRSSTKGTTVWYRCSIRLIIFYQIVHIKYSRIVFTHLVMEYQLKKLKKTSSLSSRT